MIFGNQMGVSKNSGTPKSSILIEFSIISHPFWDTTSFSNTQMLQTFLFIVALPLTNVFLPLSDTDFQLWLPATFWPVDRQSSNALYF